MKTTLKSLAPMLAVKNVGQAAAYYKDCLGFEVLFVAEDTDVPGYAVVHRDDFEVHFLENLGRDPADVRSGFNARVDDVDKLYEQFQTAGAFDDAFPRHLDAIREHGPEDKEYGMRDIIFVDPNGYILVFGQPL